MKLVVAVCILLVSASFAFGEDEKIVGGSEAVPHSYPFIAAITLDGLCCCGASILDEYHVLTAAHCVEGRSYFEVIAGAHNPFVVESSQQRQIVYINSVTIHEAYNYPGNLDNDIAMMRLSEPLTFNEYVQPIYPATREEPVGDIVKAIGWGMVADSLPGNVDNLREVSVPVLDDYYAEASYPGMDFSTKICIDARGGQGVCQGDSGGPLVDDQGGQQGVASFVSGYGCESGYPHCFTSVPYFTDWIAQNMKK